MAVPSDEPKRIQLRHRKGRAQMTTTGVWCVAWLDRDGKKHWCATYAGRKPTARGRREALEEAEALLRGMGAYHQCDACADAVGRLPR